MVENSILIPVDFTPASDKAIEFGIHLAKKGHYNISLLHVFDESGLSMDKCEAKLKALADKVSEHDEIFCDHVCERGNIFTVIPKVAAKSIYHMMVIGTHGPKGIRQKFFGPDILKLLKKVCIPALVVQENSMFLESGFSKAIFPVGGHDEYSKKIDAITTIAGLFDPEIHLYSISRAGFEQTEKLRENIKLAEQRFSEKGLNFKRINDDQKVFSVGFAKQTLQYSGEVKADLITIMSNPTRENYYFADSDKVAILTNELQIPVLCASKAETEV